MEGARPGRRGLGRPSDTLPAPTVPTSSGGAGSRRQGDGHAHLRSLRQRLRQGVRSGPRREEARVRQLRMRHPRAGAHLRALRLPRDRPRRGDAGGHVLLCELRAAPGVHRRPGPRTRPRAQLKGAAGGRGGRLQVIRIGLSGWSYGGWRGRFYPEDLPQRCELAYAAALYGTIEVNGTFYGLQQPASFGRWHDETPPGFVFAVKGPRYITHMRRLRDVCTPLANFLASGLLRLAGKLGPILWQFPASMRYDPARFEEFFRLLPRNTTAAQALARGHGKLRGRAWLAVPGQRRMRH